MKNNNRKLAQIGKFIVILLFLGGTVASCSKDKDNDENLVNRTEFAKSFFDITNGDFTGRPMPSSNSQSLNITDISGNSTVLAGGSNFIQLMGSENASRVVVGVQNEAGYFTVPMTSNGQGESMVDLRLLIGQSLSDTFTLSFAVSDGQGNFSEYQYLTVNLMDAGTGVLQVSLSWDQLNDVDLHVIEPDGTEIYYGNRLSVSGGQLDVDSNPACNIDNINNENIYYEDSPDVTIPFGEYEVLVDLWSNCDLPSDTNYTIVVYYGGNLIATTQGVNPFAGVLTPADESGNTNLISVMKFNIDGAPAPRTSGNQNQMSLPSVYKFSFDENNKVFKNFSPKK